MEKELKNISRKFAIWGGMLGIIVSIAILVLIFVGIYGSTGIFYFNTMLYIFLLPVIVFIILVIRKLKFINESHFTYGEVKRIEKSKENDDDVYQNYIIEYIDETTNKTYEIKGYSHYGDYDDTLKEEINKFFKDGEELLGRKVPLLYKTNEPNRTIVFLDKAK